MELIARLQRENLDREVAVLIPELVKTHWWQSLLHMGRAERLRSLLLKEAGAGLVVIKVPWKLSKGGPGARTSCDGGSRKLILVGDQG